MFKESSFETPNIREQIITILKDVGLEAQKNKEETIKECLNEEDPVGASYIKAVEQVLENVTLQLQQQGINLPEAINLDNVKIDLIGDPQAYEGYLIGLRKNEENKSEESLAEDAYNFGYKWASIKITQALNPLSV